MFWLIEKMFIGLPTDLCVLFLKHMIQKHMIHPTLINLPPNEYSQTLHYYSFVVKLDPCVGNYNTLNELSNKVCVPNKREDLNIHVLNVTTGKN